MNARLPRASLCIGILTDQDFRMLMRGPRGVELFGVFTALVLVGRERLTQGKANRIEGTDALTCHDRLDHLCDLACITREQLDNCLKALDAITRETGSEPWISITSDGLLVIRSFFKFNTSDNHGGARPGAGRPRNPEKPPAPSSPLKSAAPEPKPQVANDPAEIERVEKRCNDLFPATGWHVYARLSCNFYPTAWVIEALQVGAERNAGSWGLVRSVLERFQKQGASDSELRARRSASVPRASPMEGQMARDREAAKRLKAKVMALEDQNGRE